MIRYLSAKYQVWDPGKRIQSNLINSNCPCSALYARNPAPISIQDRLDAIHKAQHVGKNDRVIVQNLDVFALDLGILCQAIDFLLNIFINRRIIALIFTIINDKSGDGGEAWPG